MIYGYARCSTNELRQDIDRQKRELKLLGASDETIYFEYESGAKADRPELGKLLRMVSCGDTIVTTEVSRITRSTRQLCDIIEVCKDKKLKLVIKGSITIDCSLGELDPMTKAFLQISGVFAELERNIISERVKSGMRNAKAKGISCGRGKTSAADIPATFKKYYAQYKAKEINKSELAKLAEVTRPTAYKYIEILDGGANE